MDEHGPLNAALRAALSKAMVELDALRIMRDLEPYGGRRSFTARELEEGAALGLLARIDGHGLLVWSES